MVWYLTPRDLIERASSGVQMCGINVTTVVTPEAEIRSSNFSRAAKKFFTTAIEATLVNVSSGSNLFFSQPNSEMLSFWPEIAKIGSRFGISFAA